MNWRIEVKPSAVKTYSRLDRKTKQRIKQSLHELELCKNPFHHNDVKALTGTLHGDYRLRVGNWRILFTPDDTLKILYVYAILPRGNAY